ALLAAILAFAVLLPGSGQGRAANADSLETTPTEQARQKPPAAPGRGDRPEDADSLAYLGHRLRQDLLVMHSRGLFLDSLMLAEEAEKLCIRYLELRPDDGDSALDCAELLVFSADLARDAGRMPLARRFYTRAADLVEALENDARVFSVLGGAFGGMGEVLAARGACEEAHGHFERSLRMFRQAEALDQGRLIARIRLVFALQSLGYSHCRLGRQEQGLALYREALHLSRRTLAEDEYMLPEVLAAVISETAGPLGKELALSGHGAEGMALLREALEQALLLNPPLPEKRDEAGRMSGERRPAKPALGPEAARESERPDGRGPPASGAMNREEYSLASLLLTRLQQLACVHRIRGEYAEDPALSLKALDLTRQGLPLALRQLRLSAHSPLAGDSIWELFFLHEAILALERGGAKEERKQAEALLDVALPRARALPRGDVDHDYLLSLFLDRLSALALERQLPARALAANDEGLLLMLPLVAACPEEIGWGRQYARLLMSRAKVLRLLGADAAARSCQGQALQLLDGILERAPRNFESLALQLRIVDAAGASAQGAGDKERARALRVRGMALRALALAAVSGANSP
ncbi:tetratricopeptide repeat protein, partial [Desulfovibrio sp. OttesenSCG-928-A18]|nr:tetratricopeptide repeat protein [Desulfovibrio sp. OttesenSCG-928-A18]